jgi:hypothetical protein
MTRLYWIAAFTVACAAVALLAPAVPQPLGYHDFADARVVLGIPNFFDVAANVGFLVAGAAGLIACARRRAAFERAAERWPYAVFFAGLLLTAGGSAWYHLDPDNERLFWDRLPMTIAFMALVATQVGDRMDRRFGLALLVPLLLVGASSVVYWRATERAGAGNVLPYAVLQGYTVLVLLLIALLQPSRYTRGRDMFQVFGWYVLAKLFELLDRAIFDLTNVVSGHTLKHLSAGVAGLLVCRMLWLRVPRQRPDQEAAPC